MRKVIKFGGTSIGSPSGLSRCLDIVQDFVEKGTDPLVVVSAFKNDDLKFTDALIQCATSATAGNKTEALRVVADIRSRVARLMTDAGSDLDPGAGALFDELADCVDTCECEDHGNGKDRSDGKDHSRGKNHGDDKIHGDGSNRDCGNSRDAVTARIKSFGERITSRIFAGLLNGRSIKASAHDAYDLGLVTTDDYDNAMVLQSSYPRIRQSLRQITRLPVITGFIGKNKNGEVTTFQRSGSDYTATIIARALGPGEVDEVILYTDVEGLYSGNPIYIESERLKRNEVISFDVAEEGAYQKVKIPPGAIQPLVRTGINLVIRPLAANGRETGTIITEAQTYGMDVSFITAKTVHFVNFKSAEMATRAGFLSRIFARASRNNINIDLLSTTSTTVGMSVETESTANLESFVTDLQAIPGCDGVMVLKDYAQINVIGSGIVRDFTRILHEAVTVLKMYEIKVDAVSTGFGVNVGFVMAPKYTRLAVDRLHYHLVEKKG